MLAELLEKLGKGETLDPGELNSLVLAGRDLDAVSQLVKSWDGGGKKISYSSLGFPLIGEVLSTVIDSDVASFSVEVPPNYKHLLFFLYGRSDAVANANEVYLQINGDTGSNYSGGYVWGHGASTVAAFQYTDTQMSLGQVQAASSPSNSGAGIIGFIPHYNNNDFWKCVTTLGPTQRYDGTYGSIEMDNVFWKNTDAIHTLLFFLFGGANYKAGTVLSIYGLG